MKIKIEIDEHIKENEVIIRCGDLNSEVERVRTAISEATNSSRSFMVHKDNKEYYLDMDDILFFETEGSDISVHTVDEQYKTSYKLYELEEILPGHFMRVSKSTILNTNKVYSITKNLSSASVIEFKNTIKKIYVSRHYYRPLKNKLDEKRSIL